MSHVFREVMLKVCRSAEAGPYTVGLYTPGSSDLSSPWPKLAEESLEPSEETLSRIRAEQNRLANLRLVVRDDLILLGRNLSKILLPDPVREELRDIFAEVAGVNRILRLRLHIEPPELRDLPWEYLHLSLLPPPPPGIQPNGEFLSASPFVSIVRQSTAPSPTPHAGQGETPGEMPLRALLVWADTDENGSHSAGGLTEMLSATKGLTKALSGRLDLHYLGGEANLSPEKRATEANIRRALTDTHWDVILFIGHGRKNLLYVESEQPGKCGYFEADELARLLSRTGVQIAMFDACDTYLLAARVAATVPIVVAVQFPIPVITATTFWRAFFHAFSEPVPIDVCVREGRSWAMNMASDLPDWGAPVLFRGGQPTLLGSEYAVRSKPENAPRTAPGGTRSIPARDSVHLRRTPPNLKAFVGKLTERADKLGLDCVTSAASNLSGPAASEVSEVHDLVPDVIAKLLGRDAWAVLLLGTSDPSKRTDPIWLTSLRAAPAFLKWPASDGASRYVVELTCAGQSTPISIRVDADQHTVALDEPILTGQYVDWAVHCVDGDDQQETPWTRGVFRVLTPKARRSLLQAEQGIPDTVEEPLRSIALALTWTEFQLYDEAAKQLGALLPRYPKCPEGFVIRRVLAAVFKHMYDQMNCDWHWDGPEIAWAAAENNLYTRLAYCVGLGQLDVYEADGCLSCRRCGMIQPSDELDARPPEEVKP